MIGSDAKDSFHDATLKVLARPTDEEIKAAMESDAFKTIQQRKYQRKQYARAMIERNRYVTERMHERSLPAKSAIAKDATSMLSGFYNAENLRSRFQTVDTLPDIQMSMEVCSDSDSDYCESQFNPMRWDVETQVRKWNRELRRQFLEEPCSDTSGSEPDSDSTGSSDVTDVLSDSYDANSESDLDDDGQPERVTIQLAAANDVLRDKGSGTTSVGRTDGENRDESSSDGKDNDEEYLSGDASEDEAEDDDDTDAWQDGESSNASTDSESSDGDAETEDVTTDNGRSSSSTGNSTFYHASKENWEDGMSAVLSRQTSARSRQSTRTLHSQSQAAVHKEMQLMMLKRDRSQRCKITVSSPGKCVSWKQHESCMIAWTCYHVAVSHVSIQLYARGTAVAVIADRTPNSGIVFWRIPAWIPPGGTYRIRITSAVAIPEPQVDGLSCQTSSQEDCTTTLCGWSPCFFSVLPADPIDAASCADIEPSILQQSDASLAESLLEREFPARRLSDRLSNSRALAVFPGQRTDMEAATSAAAARALARDFLENRPPIMDVLQRKAWADNGHLGEPGHNPDHERSQLTVLSGATRIPGTVRHRLPELSTKAKEELELERNYRLQQLAKLPVRPLSRTDSLPVTVSFLGSIVVAKGQTSRMGRMSARSVLSEFSNERSTARKDYEKGLGIDLKAGRRRELPPTMPVNPDMSLEYRVACASDLLTSERGFHSLAAGQYFSVIPSNLDTVRLLEQKVTLHDEERRNNELAKVLIPQSSAMQQLIQPINGQNIAVFADGRVYSGAWSGGKMNGCGDLLEDGVPCRSTQTSSENSVQAYADRVLVHTVYSGGWKNGLRHGKGIQRHFFNNDKFGYKDIKLQFAYTGGFVSGLRQGPGTLEYPGGTVYKGAFKDNQPHGSGTLITSSGVSFHGLWEHGKLGGYGTLTLPSGQTISQEWPHLSLMDAVKWYFRSLREKDNAARAKLDHALRIANRLQMENLVKDARGKFAVFRKAKQNEKRSNAIKRRQAHLSKLKTKLRVKAAVASDPDLVHTRQ